MALRYLYCPVKCVIDNVLSIGEQGYGSVLREDIPIACMFLRLNGGSRHDIGIFRNVICNCINVDYLVVKRKFNEFVNKPLFERLNATFVFFSQLQRTCRQLSGASP